MNPARVVILAAAAAGLACGGPAPARKTIPKEDTVAAFGHTKVDTTGLGAAKSRTITQQQLDSQNAAIRARQRGAVPAPPKRIIRKAP